MTSPVITCLLVGAFGLFLAGQYVAGIALTVICAIIEFFLPAVGPTAPTQRDGVVYTDE